MGSGPFLPEEETLSVHPQSLAQSSPPRELHISLLHQLFTVTLQAYLGSLRGFKALEPLGCRCCHLVGCISANLGCSAKPCSFPCNCYG